jgi:ribosomal protein S18 acetylase RimI-like enzyme
LPKRLFRKLARLQALNVIAKNTAFIAGPTKEVVSQLITVKAELCFTETLPTALAASVLLPWAVDPPFQGMGLGSAILDATLKRIDETGMPAYLENSNLRNTRLYERADFVAQKTFPPKWRRL